MWVESIHWLNLKCDRHGSTVGPQGPAGEDGLSAYEVAVDNGFEGSETEWLESLRGQDGTDGTDGQDGIDGTDGVVVLMELMGLDGTDGEDGADGVDGKDVSLSRDWPVPKLSGRSTWLCIG